MDPNLDLLKTSGDPWRAGSYHETGYTSLLQATSRGAHVLHYYEETGGPWKQLGVKKKNNSTLPLLWKQRAQKRWSAKTSAPCRYIPPPLWFSILCTSAYFNSRKFCNAQVSHLGERLLPGCQWYTICQQTKTCFCLCSLPDESLTPQVVKHAPQGNQPF